MDLRRLGAIPAFFFGLAFVVIGGVLLRTVVNNTWLVPTDHIQFNDLRRKVVLGGVDRGELISAADTTLILIFLFAVLLLFMGLFMPLIYYINRRLQVENSVALQIVVRQALWVGLWVVFSVWLRMHRAFGLAIALLTATIFVMFEGLLLLRARSNYVGEE